MVMRGLRKSMKAVMWIIVVSFVATIFFAWGMRVTGRQTLRRDVVARVNGKDIDITDFQREWRRTREIYRDLYGNQYDPKTMDPQLRRMVLDEMIQRELLAEEAMRNGIVVSDEEVVKSISSNPAFQSGGKFDIGRYNRILDYMGMLPSTFEEQERRNLMISKLRTMISSGVRVSDEEVENYYRRTNEQVKVRYVLVKPEDFLGKASPSEQEMRSYYEKHMADFKDEKTGKARPFEGVRATIKGIMERDKAEEMARDIAKRISRDAKSGGLLKAASAFGLKPMTTDFFSRVGYVKDVRSQKEFIMAAFSLKGIGDVSEPVGTPEGQYIIELVGMKGIDEAKFREEKEKIRDTLLQRRRIELENEWIRHLRERAKIKMNLSAIEREGEF
jgi:peptidyl-prolyl cis-trans isomerase D